MNTSASDSIRSCFLTLRFLGLQGLKQVATGGLLLAAIAVSMWTPRWSVCSFLALFILLGISWWLLDAYYERKFGYMEVRRTLWTGLDGVSLLRRGLWGSGVVLMYGVALKLFDSKFDHVGALMGGLFVGFFVVDRRPWYYLVCATGFFIVGIVNRPIGADIEVWLLPICLIVTGALDHLLLLRSLPGLKAAAHV